MAGTFRWFTLNGEDGSCRCDPQGRPGIWDLEIAGRFRFERSLSSCNTKVIGQPESA